MIVCHCAVVSDRDVVASVAAGSTTVAAVCRETSAGRACGGCVSSIKSLLCQDGPHERVPILEVEDAAP